MTFWSGQTLKRRVIDDKLVEPFDERSIECSAYALHVGYEAYVTRDQAEQAVERTQAKAPGHIYLPSGGSISIPSGQFAFLITQETISIPPDVIGFLSIKSGKKLAGLVNVSGFHVDPGWSGRLIFGVFNAGPLPIVIRPEDKLFLLFFANLTEPATQDFLYTGNSKYREIPAHLMQGMAAPVPTVYKLNQSLIEIKESVKTAEGRSTFALALATAATTVALASLALVVTILIRVLQT